MLAEVPGWAWGVYAAGAAFTAFGWGLHTEYKIKYPDDPKELPIYRAALRATPIAGLLWPAVVLGFMVWSAGHGLKALGMAWQASFPGSDDYEKDQPTYAEGSNYREPPPVKQRIGWRWPWGVK